MNFPSTMTNWPGICRPKTESTRRRDSSHHRLILRLAQSARSSRALENANRSGHLLFLHRPALGDLSEVLRHSVHSSKPLSARFPLARRSRDAIRRIKTPQRGRGQQRNQLRRVRNGRRFAGMPEVSRRCFRQRRSSVTSAWPLAMPRSNRAAFLREAFVSSSAFVEDRQTARLSGGLILSRLRLARRPLFLVRNWLMVELCDAMKKEIGEKPTVAEVCELLAWGVRGCSKDILADINSFQVESLKPKLSSKGKIRPRQGDVVAIPAGPGEFSLDCLCGWVPRAVRRYLRSDKG